MKNTIKKGFTLIELLVVITIIWILATGATSVYTSQIQKARDTTRINDIKALQWGIEQFYQDETLYPRWWKDWSGTWWVQAYVPKLAEDPKHNQTCMKSRCGYIYFVWNDSNGITDWAYEISTAFESKWNHDKKAVNTKDSWDDDDRLEVGIPTSATMDTSKPQTTAFTNPTTALANSNTDATIVIKNSMVTKY